MTDKIYVPIKLIVTDDAEVTNHIIRATNRQTMVNPEAFESLSPFHKNLEEFYSSFGKNQPVKLFYERRSKQYDSLSIKKEQIITLTGQLKSFLSMFLNEPHSTHRYYGELLKAYRSKIFVEGHSPFPYYVSGYAFTMLESAFDEQVIGREFKTFRFQLLMLFRLLTETSKLPYLNNNKIDSYCEGLLEKLKSPEYRHATFQKSVKLIEDGLAQNGYSFREAARIKSFTTQLIKSVEIDGLDNVADVKFNQGVVRWFSMVKGYGFIECKGFERDVFIHHTDIAEQGYTFPLDGQEVEFILVNTEKGLVAKELRITRPSKRQRQ